MRIEDLKRQTGVVKEPLPAADAKALLSSLHDWRIEEGAMPILAATFKFKDFVRAVAFTNRIAELAEENDHHPEITLEYGKVSVRWWTHTAKGIAVNDFLLAKLTSDAYARTA